MLNNWQYNHMKKLLKFSTLLLLATAIFTACGDKDNNPAENPAGDGEDGGTYQSPSSKLTRVVFSGAYSAAADFTWEGDLLTQVILNQETYPKRCTFSYGSDGITSIYKYWPDGLMVEKTEFYYTDGKITKVVRSDSDDYTNLVFYYRYTNNKITEINDSSDVHYPKSYYLTWTDNNITHVRVKRTQGAAGVDFVEEEIPVIQMNAKNPLYMPMGIFQFDIAILALGDDDVGLWTPWCKNMVKLNPEFNIDLTLNSDGYPIEGRYNGGTVIYSYAD